MKDRTTEREGGVSGDRIALELKIWYSRPGFSILSHANQVNLSMIDYMYMIWCTIYVHDQLPAEQVKYLW